MAVNGNHTPTKSSPLARNTTQDEDKVEVKTTMNKSTEASWTYFFISLLFRFVMRVFYSNITVEGTEFIPKDGIPCILTSNHSNSLTDALLLVITVPRSKRKLLRLTAKDTQFHRKTFTSWLIENAGTLPIKRPKDHLGIKVDNSIVFGKLIEALEAGDMVCMFPEGLSRYYPLLAPLKQGVARIVSDVLSRQKDNPKFELAVQTCSITYLHRNLFRSSVLVTFHPPLIVSPQTHPTLIAPSSQTTSNSTSTFPATSNEATTFSYDSVRQLTNQMEEQIKSGILDAPSWKYIRAAHTARRLYAPLGTKLGLGDYVRLTQRFVDVLANGKTAKSVFDESVSPLKTPMVSRKSFLNGNETTATTSTSEEDIKLLVEDLKTYQDLLYLHGIKDDRVRNPRMLRKRTLLKRLVVRIIGGGFLFLISIPGLILWTPIFYVATKESEKQKKTGPVFDTYDEVAQTKLVWGLLTGLIVYSVVLLLTLPFLPFTFFFTPLLMWLTLRWLEDLTSSIRAALALIRLLCLGKGQLKLLNSLRNSLELRVRAVAKNDCGLPENGNYLIRANEGRKGSRFFWNGFHFFSVRSRRKKDWNEVLRLSDVTEYPEDDYLVEEVKKVE